MEKLQKYAFPNYLIDIVASFLSKRKITIDEINVEYGTGVPQGSSMGPLLWNVYMNDIFDLHLGPEVRIQAFADKLIQIQRISLISIVEAYKTVGDASLSVIAGIPPLDLKLNEMKKVYQLFKYRTSYTTENEEITFQNIYADENLKRLGNEVESTGWNGQETPMKVISTVLPTVQK